MAILAKEDIIKEVFMFRRRHKRRLSRRYRRRHIRGGYRF